MPWGVYIVYYEDNAHLNSRKRKFEYHVLGTATSRPQEATVAAEAE